MLRTYSFYLEPHLFSCRGIRAVPTFLHYSRELMHFFPADRVRKYRLSERKNFSTKICTTLIRIMTDVNFISVRINVRGTVY